MSTVASIYKADLEWASALVESEPVASNNIAWDSFGDSFFSDTSILYISMSMET
jgi:hypothetical protein